MKFILHKPTNNAFAPDLVSKTDGVFLKYKISQFFAPSGGWQIPTEIMNEIESYQSKPVYLSIQWGNACGNAIWNSFPFIELYEKRKEGTDPTLPKHYEKYPVPYNTKYLDKVASFLAFLAVAINLNNIVLKVCGINEVTFELRVPNQDFQFTDNPKEAYNWGGAKWVELGYTNELMREALQRLLNDHNRYFPNTFKIVAPIAVTNGFPKLNDDGTINTVNPPNLTDDLITYMKWFPKFAIMPTALTATGGTPPNMVNSGLPVHYQLNNTKLNKSTTMYEFEHALLNGRDHKAESIEVYEINVREHYDIITKYRT